jgi:hypothetical protein
MADFVLEMMGFLVELVATVWLEIGISNDRR